MQKKMKSTGSKEWHLKLRVTLEEETRIRKEAIDNRMKISEYVKLKVLGVPSVRTTSIEGKSS